MKKLFKQYLKNEKGLTLIELLVVVVILGIIAAIAVVSIGGIIGKTKEKAQVTEAVQIINGAKLAYSTDGKMPTGGWNKDNLAQYVNNLKDTDWSVTYTESTKVYTITKHDAAKVVGKTADAATDEADLTKYLGGE